MTDTVLPSSISAGTTIAYRRSVADYPASAGWTLKLSLAGPSVLTVTAVAAGDAYDVTITAVQTAALLPGTYTWLERVENAGPTLKHDVGRGSVTVLPDVAAATAGSLQSWEERTLTVVELAISGQLTSGMASYQIHGRAVSKIPMEDLLKLRNQLKAAIAARKTGAISQTILTRFVPPGFDQ